MCAKQKPYGAVTHDDWRLLHMSLDEAIKAHSINGGSFVEIGTLSAKTTKAVAEVLHDNRVLSTLITIDKSPAARSAFDGQFKDWWGTVSVQFVQGLSKDVLGDWDDLKVVWAFVDGCHCEECVAADIANLIPKMVPGGVIVFHDAGIQAALGMTVHKKYHGDGKKRLYGVTTAIGKSEGLKDFELLYSCQAKLRPPNEPTPIFGGVQVWRKPWAVN